MRIINRMTWLHWVLCCFYAIIGTGFIFFSGTYIGFSFGWSHLFGSYLSVFSSIDAAFIFLICGFNLIFLDGRFGPIWPELKPESK